MVEAEYKPNQRVEKDKEFALHSHLENKVTCREYKVGEREERALVVQARKKKKHTCYFLGVSSKQVRLDLILPKF